MKKTWILFLTVLSCALFILPVQAEKPEEEVTVFEINELYRGVIPEKQLRFHARTEPDGEKEAAGISSDAVFDSVKEAGSYLRQAMVSRSETSVFTYRISADAYDNTTEAFRTLTRAVFDEALEHTGNPHEGDYLKWQWSNWKASRTTQETEDGYEITVTYTLTYFTDAAQEAETDEAIRGILASFALPENITQYGKIEQIYDWATTHITYTDDGTTHCHSCHAAVIDGAAVCQGYALTVYRLAMEMGVSARLIPGTASGENHGWNIIELDGRYYNLDATWDGMYREGGRNWFLKGSGNFEGHVRWGADRRYDYDSEAFHAAWPMDVSDYDASRLLSVRRFVGGFYEKCLSRTGEKKGLLNWSGLLYFGRGNAADVVLGFFHSPEFVRRNVSDSVFADICYRVFLGREPDASGKKNWTDHLAQGLSRDWVLKGFLNSKEFKGICASLSVEKGEIVLHEARDCRPMITGFVSRLYTQALNRRYDIYGLNDWVSRIASGSVSPKEAALTGFLSSAEFAKRNLNNTEYIKVLYRVFMDREGEADGIRYWNDQLLAGKTRRAVAEGFADSREFAEIRKKFGV